MGNKGSAEVSKARNNFWFLPLHSYDLLSIFLYIHFPNSTDSNHLIYHNTESIQGGRTVSRMFGRS